MADFASGSAVFFDSKSIEQGLTETIQKVESSLLTAIEQHVSATEVSHGLDFLDTKNSLLLSYLIDLSLHLRNVLLGREVDEENLRRLIEMRTVLDKLRNLDKRLRYQIDKLLAFQSNASSFATAGVSVQEDPLQFRPSVEAMEENGDNDSSSDDESSVPEGTMDLDKASDDDDDLAAARQTLKLAKKDPKKAAVEESDVYRAPRIASTPYTYDKEDREAEREKRQRRRMRASELAQALRSQYGDAPEQQDIHGGTELGKQREASRRMEEREAEKTRFEEDQMVRLTTTRKEKKEKIRLQRAEHSNLSAIAGLGNLMRDAAFGDDDNEDDRDDRRQVDDGVITSGRHSSGKRKRQVVDKDGRASQVSKGKSRSIQSRNSLQAALFESGSGGGKKKKGTKRR
jgi:U3 small nucleolar ribonucleoprotein protein LCP5